MQRHKIILGNNTYIVDRFKPKDLSHKTTNRFVMFRKYDFMDDVTFDTDVYVVDEKIYRKWKESEFVLAFPNTYSNSDINQATTFSTNMAKFNETFSYNNNDLLPITKENGEELADISCDVIRIYHPHTKVRQDYLIYIDSYINSVHWHFYCSPVNQLSTKSETEFEIDNIYYSEYVEFTIPNIEALFYNTYYNDEINFIEGMNSSCVSMNLFKTPFLLEQDNEGNFYKSYIDYETYKDKNNKLFCDDASRYSNSLSISLYPYKEIDETTEMYLMDEDILPNNAIYTTDIKFTLSASFVLNELPILLCTFNYPNDVMSSFIEAYCYYNNVTLDEYRGLIYENSEDDDEEEHEAYGDVEGEEMKLCGFKLIVANDVKFKNIIHEEINWDFDFDDFSFQLNNIFDNWNQYPEILVCKAQFIDRYLGNIIESNQVIITKEQYKYLVNPLQTTRVQLPNVKELECNGEWIPNIN